jgi:hypothetical protein
LHDKGPAFFGFLVCSFLHLHPQQVVSVLDGAIGGSSSFGANAVVVDLTDAIAEGNRLLERARVAGSQFTEDSIGEVSLLFWQAQVVRAAKKEKEKEEKG